jgi:fatty aldehyde-generating acyl-ACP reductase
MPFVDFALIAHPESWSSAAAVVSALRGPERSPIPLEDLREILPWIPPRAICQVTVESSKGNHVHGLYIDTFIPPDRLENRYLRENLARVREAAQCALREGARIATLGGFSSILLEGKTDLLPPHAGMSFTTGNTLTVALIMRGIERAVMLSGRELSDLSVLVVGASGDVGSGCARCLAPKVKRLLICARNPDRLRVFASEFSSLSDKIEAETDLLKLIAKADVVVCAASAPNPIDLLEALPPDAIVCDAGYPKNLPLGFAPGSAIFYGGLGEASGGIKLYPDLFGVFYPYGLPNLAHGCLLEGIALAMEKRYEPFSQGRGLITPERVEEIWRIAVKHGIGLPPLFNGDGLVEEDLSRLPQDIRR